MAINSKLLDALGRSVDQSEAVFLSRLERELADSSIWGADVSSVGARIIHLAVDA